MRIRRAIPIDSLYPLLWVPFELYDGAVQRGVLGNELRLEIVYGAVGRDVEDLQSDGE